MAKMETFDIVQIIRSDHRSALSRLPQFEKTASAVERADPVDYHQLSDLLDYFTGPESRLHHLYEDAAYGWLKEHRPVPAGPLPDLGDEHAKLAVQLDRLDLRLRAIMADHDVSRADMASHLRDFQTMQFNHIRLEELVFFPLIDLMMPSHVRHELVEQVMAGALPIGSSLEDTETRTFITAR